MIYIPPKETNKKRSIKSNKIFTGLTYQNYKTDEKDQEDQNIWKDIAHSLIGRHY